MRLNDMNENHVTLKIFEFSDSPEELTNAIGLEPTKTAVKGNKYGKLNKPYPWNYWEYRWVRKEERYIGGLVEEFFLKVVEPKKDILRNILMKSSGELSVVQYLYQGCNPGLHINSGDLTTLNYIGAELDIDIYCMSENGQENA